MVGACCLCRALVRHGRGLRGIGSAPKAAAFLPITSSATSGSCSRRSDHAGVLAFSARRGNPNSPGSTAGLKISSACSGRPARSSSTLKGLPAAQRQPHRHLALADWRRGWVPVQAELERRGRGALVQSLIDETDVICAEAARSGYAGLVERSP